MIFRVLIGRVPFVRLLDKIKTFVYGQVTTRTCEDTKSEVAIVAILTFSSFFRFR